MKIPDKYVLPEEVDAVFAWTEEVADGEYEHYVAFCNDFGDPVDEIPTWIHWKAGDALDHGRELADEFHLELITDDLMMGG